jgi:predicted ribosome quality control (RQC) complex YloA/Tae2 family protein
MQPLDAVTLKALAAQWEAMLLGSRIAKVMHPSAHEFLLTFWGGAVRDTEENPNHCDLLYIHLGPEAPFACLTESRQRHNITLNTFEKPTAMCMGLRKQLGGAVFLETQTLPGERVVNFVFENYNELGQRVRLVLSLELMGKHTNMILYDDEQKRMVAVAHGVSESMSRHRELAAGLSYAPPPFPANKKLLSSLSCGEFVELWRRKPTTEDGVAYLNRAIAGWGQSFLQDALAFAKETVQNIQPATAAADEASVLGEALYRVLFQLENGEALAPALVANGSRFTLVKTPTAEDTSDGEPTRTPLDSVNTLIFSYFTRHLKKLRLLRRREQLTARMERQRNKLQRRKEELQPQLDSSEADEIEWLQATGDRLLAAYGAHEVPSEGTGGLREICLPAYDAEATDAEAWRIELDPALGWVENAKLYYRRAKKAKARRELRQQMAAPLQDALDFIDTLKQLTTQADSLAELDALEFDFNGAGLARIDDHVAAAEFAENPSQNPALQSKAQVLAKLKTSKQTGKNKAQKGKASKNKAKEKGAKLPTGITVLHSSDGLELLLGKSAQGNDAIVGKLSRADDVWLHVHQMPGSHVLIRTQSNPVPVSTLEEAAMLAAYYSAARQGLNVPVVYTEIRYVRKIPHSYPGHVNYRQEKSLFITPDPARLETLIPL